MDGQGASGSGSLVEIVVKTDGVPASADFVVTESVLLGIEGALDLLQETEIGDLRGLLQRLALEPNIPNPFNPAATMGYDLPTAGSFRLAIYNLLGQEVRVLVNESKSAGSHTTTWNGTEEQGRHVSSGVYLYGIPGRGFLGVKAHAAVEIGLGCVVAAWET